MRRCLDTTFLSDLLSGKEDAVAALERWARQGDQVLMTSINCYEVGVGIGCESPARSRQLSTVWGQITASIDSAALSANAADVAAQAQTRLLAHGRPAPLADLLVAATAFSHGCDCVVTRDVEDFRRIDLLRVESH